MQTVVPLLSGIVALLFAIFILDQYLGRRRAHQLVWAVGLLFWALASFCQFWVAASGLSEGVFRLWYWAGAFSVAAYLGMGTVYLLAPRPLAHGVMAVLVLGTALAAIRVFTAPVDLSVLDVTRPLTGVDVLPKGTTLWTIPFNVYGAAALVLGAIYSAVAFAVKRSPRHRVVSMALVALGALLPTFSGGLARSGNPDLQYVMQLLGIIVIFTGFLSNREVFWTFRVPLVHGLRRAEERPQPSP